MFIAMNRFKVIHGAQAEFEQVWKSRDTRLREVPGFLAFHLLRGPERDDHTLYSSHTTWRSRADFETWTRSEAFRLAHRDAGANRPLYLGHPEFEGFEVIQTVEMCQSGSRPDRTSLEHNHGDRAKSAYGRKCLPTLPHRSVGLLSTSLASW
jgi:heme-degrading monooxygenase HmoA